MARRWSGGQDGWWVYKAHTLSSKTGVNIHSWFGVRFQLNLTVNTYSHASSQDHYLFLAKCCECLKTTIKLNHALIAMSGNSREDIKGKTKYIVR